MGTFSIWHWLIVGAVVLLLFGGGGKIPKLMRDMGMGINAFKKGLKETKEDDTAEAGEEERKTLEGDAKSVSSSTVDQKEKASSDA